MNELSLRKTEKEIIGMLKAQSEKWDFMDKTCKVVILGGDGEVLAEADSTKTTRQFCYDMLNNIPININVTVLPL